MQETRGGACALSVIALLLSASLAGAQATPSPTPGSTPPGPPSPVSGMRSKISAGDLASAESILEVYRARAGEDGDYLVGLSWLARGALYLGERDKAKRYAADVRGRCASQMAQGNSPAKDRSVETALGAAIETQAQLVERESGAPAAIELVKKELEGISGPVALRARLNKRLNMLGLAGTPAPEIVIEDFIGEQPPTLSALRGQPVLLILWAPGCPDCDAQSVALADVRARYAEKGLRVLALTRYYSDEAPHAIQKQVTERAWRSVYADLGDTPVAIGTAAMERYGGSSTPTLIFIDRAGIVRKYVPTRLTEADLDREVAAIAR
jgi:thiol-disulfide isomerase/thioredoxin